MSQSSTPIYNLPNSQALPWVPYFLTNSPAIGDLTGMFGVPW